MTAAPDWLGRVGDVWAAEWRRTDRSFGDLARQLNAAILRAAPESGIAIDIGCGAGNTSLALATARPQCSVTGIDLSPPLVMVASDRAKDHPNLSFRVEDAENLGELRADLLVSRHGLMFFMNPVVGFSSLRRATKPGGRLVFSCFRSRRDNEWSRVVEQAIGNPTVPPARYTPGPYALADRDFTAHVLGCSGWIDATVQAANYRYVAGAGEDPLEDAIDFLSRIGPAARLLAEAPPAQRVELVASLRAALAPHVLDDAVTFAAGAWIWTATAGEPL